MIFIVGAPRSGTTLTASVLRACGGDFGHSNGLMEHSAIRDEIIKPYMMSIGADPLCQDRLPELDELTFPEDFRDQVLNAMNGATFLKDVKMPLMWPVFNRAFPDAKWIVVRRDSNKIIDSCIRAAFMRQKENRREWQQWLEQHVARLEEINANLNSFEVWPDKAVRGDLSEYKRMSEFSGLEWTQNAEAVIKPNKWRK